MTKLEKEVTVKVVYTFWYYFVKVFMFFGWTKMLKLSIGKTAIKVGDNHLVIEDAYNKE